MSEEYIAANRRLNIAVHPQNSINIMKNHQKQRWIHHENLINKNYKKVVTSKVWSRIKRSVGIKLK